MNKTALLLGATGLTGEQCLLGLLTSERYSKVTVVVRRPLSLSHPKLHTVLTDFKNITSIQAELKADDVFCCLGTTIAKAGSQEAFRWVDFDIPEQIAERAVAQGAQQFILCSSMGADAGSAIFYSRVKGELEQAVSNMGFKAVHIFRPSILLGDRKEQRTGEAIGRFAAEKLSFLFAGPFKKYAGTPVKVLAKKMIEAAAQNTSGIQIHENDEILAA
ncbi:MAG: NAD(P)H-binding protein [Bacteroidetes bacterium]|nr:NAD(P)H-binding protein [Bacteroidota bacterium]